MRPKAETFEILNAEVKEKMSLLGVLLKSVKRETLVYRWSSLESNLIKVVNNKWEGMVQDFMDSISYALYTNSLRSSKMSSLHSLLDIY